MDVKIAEPIPKQNYSNRFVGETTLEFTATKSAQVRLDVLGSRVKTIVDQRCSRGTHWVCWSSESLSRGVYLVRMEVYDRLAGVQRVVRW